MWVDEFLIKSTGLRCADIATHLADNVFMQMSHESLDNHQGLMCYGRPYRPLEITSIKQGLGSSENVGVKHVTRVPSTFNVLGGVREGLDDLSDFLGNTNQNLVRLFKCPHELCTLGQIDSVDTSGLAGYSGTL